MLLNYEKDLDNADEIDAKYQTIKISKYHNVCNYQNIKLSKYAKYQTGRR
jgi:hypothetical protein